MERLTNFSEVRQAFAGVASAERSDERVSNENITDILSANSSFMKLDEETRKRTLVRLDFLSKIQWRNPVRPLSDNMLKVGSGYLQKVLPLESDPSSDLAFEGPFWKSDQRSELSEKLQLAHHTVMSDLRKNAPDTALAADAIGTAAHWTVRNAGATWSEAVEASRYAETSLVPSSHEFKAHEMIVINFMAARHGGIKK